MTENVSESRRAARTHFTERGWTATSADEFLGLTPEESWIVSIRIDLGEMVRERRRARGISQESLAQQMSSSQSRVAKLESGDASVSIDLLLRAAFATGATREDVGKVILGKDAA